jgi:uncharacterized membrane protein YcaP (DUF421 family)
MDLQEFKTKKLAYEELLKVTTLPVREATQEDMNRHDISSQLIVDGSIKKLLLTYLKENEKAILEALKSKALTQLKADKAAMVLAVETEIATIKKEIL